VYTANSHNRVEKALASVLPADSWERLPGESPKAYAVFYHFMDHAITPRQFIFPIIYAQDGLEFHEGYIGIMCNFQKKR